jgi:hypothetical protein
MAQQRLGMADLLKQEEQRLAAREAQPPAEPAAPLDSESPAVQATARPAVAKAASEPGPAGATRNTSRSADRRKLAAAPEPAEVAGEAGVPAGQAALDLVLESCASARNDPRSWEDAPVRLPLDLARRLKIRLATDKGGTGNRQLGANHYLNVAFGRIPEDLRDAAAWGLAWRQAHATVRTENAGSGSRLHKETAARMAALADWLRTLDVHPALWQVEAEALTRLLAELDGPSPGESPAPRTATPPASAPGPPPP